jgi:hypothetical protein
MVENYEFLNIPRSCEVKNTIFKKMFYENGDLSAADKALFTDAIKKIIWLYCLKPETINIQPYKDDTREYEEVEIIEVELDKEKRTDRIAEIIMRNIPYPMVLIFRLRQKIKLYVAHQRYSLSDNSKNTIEELVSTEWVDNDSVLLEKLDIMQMRFTNFYALYSDIVDIISIYNLSEIMATDENITGAEARELSAKIEDIEQEIASLRAKLKKESQFNRKMGLNIEIKRLEQLKNKLTGGKSQ